MDNKLRERWLNLFFKKIVKFLFEKKIMHSLPLTILSLMIVIFSCTPKQIQIPQWHPYDFTFKSNNKHNNPFDVYFTATVNGPGGVEFVSLGFYDGDNTWKVRVAPHIEGSWSLETKSDDPQLDGDSVSFLCVPNDNPNVHGGLLVDSEHPYHFVFEDGTRYFLMGYECDCLWALDVGDNSLPKINSFLDELKANGFNHIILNAYAHDTKWRKGKTSNEDYGPPPMYAWEGSNENPVHDRFNLAYWQHYDRMMDALYQRGIIAHIMIKVYNKMVNWPEIGSEEDELYFKWIIARYAAYPNVVWDFSKEAHNEKNLEYKLRRFRLIHECDPYDRMVTNHDDNKAYDSGAYNGLLSFRSDQQHKEWHRVILEQRNLNAWPVVNVEFGYEHGPKGIDDYTYKVVQEPEEVTRRAWEICLAGGYIAYYYTYTAWDIIRPEEIPPGYAYFKNLWDFFENTNYWLMEPADELVSEGYCLANPGKEYIVFLNNAKPFTLKIAGINGKLNAEWYHPFTGDREDGGQLTNGTVSLTPPTAWGDAPVVLYIKK